MASLQPSAGGWVARTGPRRARSHWLAPQGSSAAGSRSWSGHCSNPWQLKYVVGVTWVSPSLWQPVGAGQLQSWGTAPGKLPRWTSDLLLYGIGETSHRGLLCFLVWTWFYFEFYDFLFWLVFWGFLIQGTKFWKNCDSVHLSFHPWLKPLLAVVASGLVSKGIQMVRAYNQM